MSDTFYTFVLWKFIEPSKVTDLKPVRGRVLSPWFI